MVKILIAADMEGISGVVHWDHVNSSHAEYSRFRKMMTGDVNAAVRGAFEGGADEVVVSDGHGTFRNVLIEELDPRARLNSGKPRPLAMVQGADLDVSAAMFIGYHARAGTPKAILAHTWSGAVANVWLNDQVLGEIGLNAAVCGYFDVPVIMISGDQTACAEASELLGPVETAIVKQAAGRMAAECLAPEVSQHRISEAARQAVSRLAEGQVPQPLRLAGPVVATIELATSDMVDRGMAVPGARRLEGKRLQFTGDNLLDVHDALRTVMMLARG